MRSTRLEVGREVTPAAPHATAGAKGTATPNGEVIPDNSSSPASLGTWGTMSNAITVGQNIIRATARLVSRCASPMTELAMRPIVELRRAA